MADSAFGKYDFHLAKDLCNEAASLASEAREKLQAAHALFLLDANYHDLAEEAEALGYLSGDLWLKAATLAHM